MSCFTFLSYTTFDFRGKSSFIEVSPNGTFIVNQPITNFDGKLIKDSGATILGENITFEQGVFENAGNSILMSSLFNPGTNTITLSGNDSFRAQPGTILQTVSASSFNNKLEGQPVFSSDIVLTDVNTTLTLAVQSRVNQNIKLNSGTLTLEDDLKFTDEKMIIGPGTVDGNGYPVMTGAKPFIQSTALSFEDCSHLEIFACAMDLSENFTFKGESSINGHGNILNLDCLIFFRLRCI